MALSKVNPSLVQNFGRRNLVINGAMQVAQRGTSGTSNTSNTYHTVDRWIEEHASSINLDFAQVSGSAPSGFQKSLKCTAQSTATLGANEYIIPFEQRFERTQIDSIGLGTSEAKTFTVSFWIKSNRTGTYTVNPTLDSPSSTSGQSTTKQYTINSADTWEYKTITFPANTNASPNVGDNAKAVTLFWWMLAGSNFTSGSLPSGWKTEVANERAVGCNNTVSTGDNWQITGVQLEVGNAATDFEHRSYGEELSACQRYYYKISDNNPDDAATDEIYFPFSCVARSTSAISCFVSFPVSMRTAPQSLEWSGTVGDYKWLKSGTYGVVNTGSFSHGGGTCNQSARIDVSLSSAIFSSAGEAALLRSVTKDAYFAWRAEL
jgi:hypothetical protein